MSGLVCLKIKMEDKMTDTLLATMSIGYTCIQPLLYLRCSVLNPFTAAVAFNASQKKVQSQLRQRRRLSLDFTCFSLVVSLWP